MPERPSTTPGRAANLLGALALAVTDRTFDAVSEVCGPSRTDAVALSALQQFLRRPTIDLLRRVLGLTSSGTVRLVDRLEASGLVRRGAAEDGRATAVALTRAGRRAARRVAEKRMRTLDDALTALGPEDRLRFEGIVSDLLVRLMREPGAERWICRLCHLEACGWETGDCPVRNAARARFGGAGEATRP